MISASAFAAIEEQIPDLRPPREVLPRRLDSSLLPWFIAAGIIAVGAGAAVCFWPREQRYVLRTRPVDAARHALAGEITPAILSQALTQYLRDSFSIPARGATPDELLGWLAAHPRWDIALAEETSAFLHACDRAKFAPDAPATEKLSASAALELIGKIESRRTWNGS